ncbi:MAG TPA: hypothetical protein VF062_03005 [Candidatus Limnocylindrales bacterium]
MTKLVAIAGIAATSLVGSPAAAAPPDNQLDRSIVHQVPRVPVTIDGTEVNPERITHYNGRPLYMAAIPGDGPDGRLVVFSSPNRFERFVREHGGPEHALAKPRAATLAEGVVRGNHSDPRPEQGSNATYIYEHADFQGAWLGFVSGYGARDLDQWNIYCQLWFCDDWDDEASSTWADNANGQTIYEHDNWTGSALWTRGGFVRGNLEAWGWNDRTSSFGSHR